MRPEESPSHSYEADQSSADLKPEKFNKISCLFRSRALQVLCLALCSVVNWGESEGQNMVPISLSSKASKPKDYTKEMFRIIKAEGKLQLDPKYKYTFIYKEDFTDKLFENFKEQYESILATGNYRMLNRLLMGMKSVLFNEAKCSKEEWAEFQDFRKKVIKFVANLPMLVVEDLVNQRIESTVNYRDKVKTAYFQKELDNTVGVFKKGDEYFIKIDDDLWRITNTPINIGWHKYVFSLVGNEYGIYFYIRTIESTEYIPSDEPLDFSKPSRQKFKPKLLSKKIKEAKTRYEEQKKGGELMAKFDLPKDEEIGYISVLPDGWDRVIRAEQEFTILLPSILKNSGYQINTEAMDDMPFIETSDPHSVIDRALEENYQNGTRYFILNLNGHADKKSGQKGISYNGSELLKANNLIRLFEEYRDCKFVIYTSSCNGGHFRIDMLEYFQQNPDTAKRVSMFLQSKPDVGTPTHLAYYDKPEAAFTLDEMILNQTSYRYGINSAKIEGYSTTYNLYFAKFILQGRAFGEAAYLADVHSQRYTINNPESIVDGQLIP
jgi:hypothetical protein